MALKVISQTPPQTSQERTTESGDIKQLSKQLMEMQGVYDAAIKKVCEKLEAINCKFQDQFDHSPIRFVETRLKTAESIYKKLKKRGCPVSPESARKNLSDIAGIRVVSYFIGDAYAIADKLLQESDIILIEKKDYIEKPKANGYRSLHLVVQLPVVQSGKAELVPVEIQIRTMMMDLWAGLDYQLKYKKEQAVDPQIIQCLKECAEKIAELDNRVQDICRKI
jgi:putative GTP pyrophosphokinase